MAATASASPQGMLCALLMLSQVTHSFLDPSVTLQSNRQVAQARKRQLYETSKDAEAAANPTRLEIWPSDFEDNTKFHHLLNRSSYDSDFVRFISENIDLNTIDLPSGDSFGFYEGKLKNRIINENEKDVKSSILQCMKYPENGRSVYDIHHHFNKFCWKTSPKNLKANDYVLRKKRPIGKFNEKWFTEPLNSEKYTTSGFNIKKELKQAGFFSESFKRNAYNENSWIKNILKSLVNIRVPNTRRLYPKCDPHFWSIHRERRKESCQLPRMGGRVHARHPRTAAWVSRLRRRSLDLPHDESKERNSYSPSFSDHQSMRRHHNSRILYKSPSHEECLSNEPSCFTNLSEQHAFSSNPQTASHVSPRPEPAVVSRLRDAYSQNITTSYVNRHKLLAPMEDRRFLCGEGGHVNMNELFLRTSSPESPVESYLNFHLAETRNLVFHNHRLVSPVREYPFLPFGIEIDVTGKTNPLYGKYREGAFQETFSSPMLNFASSQDASAKAKRKNAINIARTEYGFYRSIPIEEYYDKKWPKNPNYREDHSFKTKNLYRNQREETDGPQFLRKEKVYVPESSFQVYTKPMDEEDEGESETEYFTCVRISKPDDTPKEFLCDSMNVPVSPPSSCPFFSGGRRPVEFEDERAEKWRQSVLERTKNDYAFYDKLDFSPYIDERFPRNPDFKFDLPVFDKFQTKETHQLEYEERLEKAKTRDYVNEGNDPVEYPLSEAMREQGKTDEKDYSENFFPCPRAAIRESNNRASFTNSPLLSGRLPSGFSSKGINGISTCPSTDETDAGIKGKVREASDNHLINNHQRDSEGGESTISKEKVKNRFEFRPATPGHPLLKPLTTLGSSEDPKEAPSDAESSLMKFDCVLVDAIDGDEWENDELIKFLISDYYFEDRGENVGDMPRDELYFKNEFDSIRGIYTKSRKSFRKDCNIQPDTSGKTKAKHFWMYTKDGKKYICTRKTKSPPFS